MTPCIADQDRCMSQLFFSLLCHPDVDTVNSVLSYPSLSTPDDIRASVEEDARQDTGELDTPHRLPARLNEVTEHQHE